MDTEVGAVILLCMWSPLHNSLTLISDFNFPISGFPLDLSEDGNIFILTMQAKDLNLATASAEEVGQRCPLTFLAQNMYVS